MAQQEETSRTISFMNIKNRLIELFMWLQLIFLSILIGAATFFTIWLPDIDLMLINFLHHRSILTHSILMPLILSFFIKGKLRPLLAILYGAIGIHLAADLLAPSIGFGAIWLPEPHKVSLGEFSKVWLIFNTLIAFFLSYQFFPVRYIGGLFWGTLLAGIFYGIKNEESIISSIVISACFLSVSAYQKYRLGLSFKLQRETRQLNGSTEMVVEGDNSMEDQKSSLFLRQKLKFLIKHFLNFMKLIRFIANTFIHHPKKSIGAIALIITLAFLLNFISTTNKGSIGEGNYVKHSSGGWIKLQNGQYVPGTLTDKKP